MNDPIISPWLIYLISLSNHLITASMVVAVIAAPMALFYGSVWEIHFDETRGIRYKNIFRKSMIALCVACFIGTVVPNESTIYKMIAASYVTPANIQATGELADKAVDKVIDKIADAIQKFERSDKK